jgi:hypothetical protein
MAKRHVDHLSAVFHLSIRRALNLPKELTTHVLFLYDGRTKRREFRILNMAIPMETNQLVLDWLEANVELDHLIEGLNSNELDGDNLCRALVH